MKVRAARHKTRWADGVARANNSNTLGFICIRKSSAEMQAEVGFTPGLQNGWGLEHCKGNDGAPWMSQLGCLGNKARRCKHVGSYRSLGQIKETKRVCAIPGNAVPSLEALHPWKCPRPARMGLGAPCGSCPWQGVEWDELQGPFQPEPFVIL